MDRYSDVSVHGRMGADVVAPHDPGGTQVVDLSAHYGHLPYFRHLLPLEVKANEFTYVPNHAPSTPPRDTWLSVALDGISNIVTDVDARKAWGSVATVGTGCGLDAVGMSHLAHPERVVASDIHPRVIPVASWNIARYVHPSASFSVLESDLFGAYPAHLRFDLIYENLPNIPVGHDVFAGIRSASCYTDRSYLSDPRFDVYMLKLHRNCLIQARGRLNPSGWIVCVLGGRIPVGLVHEMFREAGFASQIVNVGLKIQTEPDAVLPGYADAEERFGISFTYYHPFEKCRPHLDALRSRRPRRPWEEQARELIVQLEPYRVSSTEALRLHRSGEPVCHTVLVFGGQPK